MREQQAESLGQSPLCSPWQRQPGLGPRQLSTGEGGCGQSYALHSPGGKAHPVQAEGKVDFSDPSPVFQQNPSPSLYIFFYI